MTALIERLEAAAEGSRELDCDICELDSRYEVPNRTRYVNGKGPFARNVHNDCSLEVPHYTTSLDAKLPGENIAHVHAPDWQSSKPAGRWQAAQDVGEGRAVFGYGHTEPLARRIATLKALEPSE